jgi:predicted enzyme related to lactoylglutathione lyase
MDIKHSAVGWFEIPAKNMERTVQSYDLVFSFKRLSLY